MQAQHGGDLANFCRQYGFQQDEVLDFSSNLNWFLDEIDDASWRAWKQAAGIYGEASSRSVSAKIAKLFSYQEQQVLATAGSIEAIYLSAQLFRERRVLIGAPGFADYQRAFRASETKTWDLSFDDPLLQWAEVVIFGSPNNPTGQRYDLSEWRARWPGKIWLVDETFVEFSASPASFAQEDVILFRSFTKSWRIPGLRLGFLLSANQEWMRELQCLQVPWSVSALAQAWARDRLTEKEKIRVERAIKEQLWQRDDLMRRLSEISGLRVHSSDANFLLIEILSENALDVWESLAQKALLTRKVEGFENLQQERFLRIAVRQAEDNEILLNALQVYFEK